MRLTSAAFAATLLASVPAAAHADAGPPGATPPLAAPVAADTPPAPATREVSYASRTLLADGLALALLAAAVAQQDAAGIGLGSASLLVYGYGAPIVHLAHRRYAAGLQSLGLRIALPLAAGAIGARIGTGSSASCDADAETHCHGTDISLGGALVGAGIGIVAASLIDARFLARERVPAGPGIAPSFGYHAGRVSVGLGGSF